MKSIRDKYETIKIYKNRLCKHRNYYNVPFIKKIKMFINGFTSDQYNRYNFDKNNMSNYISEVERWKSRSINEHYSTILDDKLLFYEFFNKYITLPKNFFWISQGLISDFRGKNSTDIEFLDVLKKESKLILKPVIDGGSGRGVYLFQYKNNDFLVNEKKVSEAILLEMVHDLKNYLACEHVEQHKYSNEIYSGSANTIRIITVCNNLQVELLDAVHRFGLETTKPVDNATKGALVARVDLQRGILSSAKTMFSDKIYTIHPDTKMPIEGVYLPHWSKVIKDIMKTHRMFPYIKFIAWDVVITEKGFTVIEGNASTGFNILQLWYGVRDKKIGEFLKSEGILK